MTETLHPSLGYVTRHRPRNEAKTSHWICVDERFAIIDGLYRQTAGGAQGTGQDVYLAHRLAIRRRNVGSHFDAPSAQSVNQLPHHSNHPTAQRISHMDKSGNLPKSYVFAATNAHVARLSGVELHNHIGCAAELTAQAIAEGTVKQRDAVWNRLARCAPPTLDKKRFNEIVDAIDEANENGWLAPADVSAPLLDKGFVHDDTEIPAVNRVELHDMQHVGTTMMLGMVTGMAFNVEAAVKDGEQDNQLYTVYHASIGDADELYGALRPAYPVLRSPEGHADFEDAMLVRNAATSLFLPQQNNQAPELRAYTMADLARI